MIAADRHSKPGIIIRDHAGEQWLSFSRPRQIFCVTSIDEVVDSLGQLEQSIIEQGLWAAGWVSYEASAAFDSALETHIPGKFPVLWFALYEHCEVIDLESVASIETTKSLKSVDWTLGIDPKQYHKNISQIKHELNEGNSYQVNYTFRQTAKFPLSAYQAFLAFAASARYGAFIDTDRFSVCSASPELFFEKHGQQIRCRPMKGTARRGRTFEEDQELRDELASSEKNRAENLMIVDMIRNDIGKIARPGSVTVSDAFAIEKYPTVWQMTSTVSADCRASLVDIFSALFPCASITGAPKASTMKIIRQLENKPRNIYTGTIGFIRPDLSMQFNVAIRTLLLNKATNQAEYGVGGGIVWDSEAESEFQECLLKSKILSGSRGDTHELLETLLWTPEEGFFLLEHHLARLQRSAAYFDYQLDLQQVRNALREAVAARSDPQRLRLLVNKQGEIQVTTADHVAGNQTRPNRVVLAHEPVDENDVFLYHKTTERSCYQSFSDRYPDYDDVLLYNHRGEITESLIANLVIEIDGKKFTPPVESGLLAGTYRQHLLESQQVTEKVISRQDLVHADQIYLTNSVRKIWSVHLEII